MLSSMIAVSLIMTATQSCSDKETSSSEPGSGAPTITFTGTTTVHRPVIEEDGGSAEVRFTVSAAWTATVSESRGIDWLTVSPASGEGGDAIITVTAQPNPNYEERNGAVTIACGGKKATFTVSQKQTDAMILSTDKVEIGSDATTIEIRLKSNVEVEYEIAGEDAGWIKPSQPSRSMTEKTLCFDISANGDAAGRTGHIGIRGAGKTEVVSIYQQGFKPAIVLGAKDAVVGSTGGEVTVEIASNISFDAELQPCDWIREKTDGSVRQEITVIQAIRTNNIVDSEIIPVMVYSVNDNPDINFYSLCTTMHGVMKSLFEDGRTEYANVVFDYHGIWDGFWDALSTYPSYVHMHGNRYRIKIFCNFAPIPGLRCLRATPSVNSAQG